MGGGVCVGDLAISLQQYTAQLTNRCGLADLRSGSDLDGIKVF